MKVLQLQGLPDETLRAPVLLFALDGWTDAGRGGSIAAEHLLDAWDGTPIGEFDPDQLFDYRDRRPTLTIDRGLLAPPVWPQLSLYRLDAPGDQTFVLVKGAEPDLGWRQLCADLAELARRLRIERYVGLGAVPAPVPHTRTVPITTTATDENLVTRVGVPHIRLTVPASCQVVVEQALGEAGVSALGLWARIPHYVAGEFPAAAVALLRALSDYLGTPVHVAELEAAANEHREQLDEAASGSIEVSDHIRQLEAAYDENIGSDLTFGQLPSGDEIAAEFERFLRREAGTADS